LTLTWSRRASTGVVDLPKQEMVILSMAPGRTSACEMHDVPYGRGRALVLRADQLVIDPDGNWELDPLVLAIRIVPSG
jgi:hypothetical protein